MIFVQWRRHLLAYFLKWSYVHSGFHANVVCPLYFVMLFEQAILSNDEHFLHLQLKQLHWKHDNIPPHQHSLSLNLWSAPWIFIFHIIIVCKCICVTKNREKQNNYNNRDSLFIYLNIKP